MTETQKANEIEQLDAEIQELETEAAAPPDLSWDEIVGLTAEELTQREQRRGILGKMIQARKAKRLQLEAEALREEATAAREGTEKTYEAFQAQDEKLQKAKERRDKAWTAWQHKLEALNNAETRIRSTDRRLRELKEGIV